MANSLDFKSVKDLSSLIKSKEISPVELLNFHLNKIEALEGKLNTFASRPSLKSKYAFKFESDNKGRLCMPV